MNRLSKAAPKAPVRRAERGQGRPGKTGAPVGREALTAAARELVKSVPPAKVTRAQIAKFAGVTPALVRYYFGNRDDLLLAATVQLWQELRARSRTQTAAARTTQEKLHARISVLLETLANNRYFNQLVTEQIVQRDSPQARRALEEINRNSFAELKGILNEGIRKKELRKVNPVFLFIVLVGSCEYLSSGRPIIELLLGSKRIDQKLIAAYAHFVLDLVLHGIGTPRLTNYRSG